VWRLRARQAAVALQAPVVGSYNSALVRVGAVSPPAPAVPLGSNVMMLNSVRSKIAGRGPRASRRSYGRSSPEGFARRCPCDQDSAVSVMSPWIITRSMAIGQPTCQWQDRAVRRPEEIDARQSLLPLTPYRQAVMSPYGPCVQPQDYRSLSRCH
jgi:hypothetical protein